MSRNKLREIHRHKCKACNKDIKRGFGYYRDGFYYCSKSHWRKLKKKLAEEKNNEQTK
jgi:hypothetical protein